MSANTDASTQFTQNLTHSFVRSMLKLLIAKLNFFTFGYLYTNLKDTAGQSAMVEIGGVLQNKSQLFNVNQVNYNVITIYKHGGKSIFLF